jgi:hypothetical protein
MKDNFRKLLIKTVKQALNAQSAPDDNNQGNMKDLEGSE